MHKPRSGVWKAIGQYADIEAFIPIASRSEMFALVRTCDIMFSAAYQETFGLNQMEAAALGVMPLQPNRLCYPEYHPRETLYNSMEEAATIAAEYETFDNAYAEAYLWKNVAPLWKRELEELWVNFTDSYAKQTTASRKMVDILIEQALRKKELMGAMGWGRLKAWGRYRAALRYAGVPITVGPDPVFGAGITSNKLF